MRLGNVRGCLPESQQPQAERRTRPAAVWLIGALVVGAVGCGSSDPPTAGGKPIEHWVAAVHAPQTRERLLAVHKLGNVGTTHPAAIPALIEAVQDRQPEVRSAAILALLPLGAAAKDALPVLHEATRDRDPKVRQVAARAVAKLEAN